MYLQYIVHMYIYSTYLHSELVYAANNILTNFDSKLFLPFTKI